MRVDMKLSKGRIHGKRRRKSVVGEYVSNKPNAQGMYV